MRPTSRLPVGDVFWQQIPRSSCSSRSPKWECRIRCRPSHTGEAHPILRRSTAQGPVGAESNGSHLG